MAWLGLIAAVGIGACLLDVLLQALGTRRDRIRRAAGRSARGRSRQVVARTVPFAAAVVVLGGVLVVARAAPGSGGSTGRRSAATQPSGSSSTLATTTTAAATTTAVGGERTPPKVRLAVLNASNVAKAASTEANTLRDAGYVIVGVGDAAVRTGLAVQCAPGFEREAVTLVKRLGRGAIVEAFPRTVPASAAGADCVVVIGG